MAKTPYNVLNNKNKNELIKMIYSLEKQLLIATTINTKYKNLVAQKNGIIRNVNRQLKNLGKRLIYLSEHNFTQKNKFRVELEVEEQ